jgi:hypothetical protein
VGAVTVATPPDRAGDYGCERPGSALRITLLMAAILNLNHPAHVVHWHFFSMSVANIVAIIVMLIVFALAIALPFPGHARGGAPS